MQDPDCLRAQEIDSLERERELAMRDISDMRELSPCSTPSLERAEQRLAEINTRLEELGGENDVL